MEEGTLWGIDVEVFNNMPVMQQIKAIEENTKNLDENTKAILEQLQNDNLAEKEFQTFIMDSQPETTEEPSEEVPDELTEEVIAEETEEVIEEETQEVIPEEIEEVIEEEIVEEEQSDYLQLIYQEMQLQNENTLALTEQIEVIQSQNEITNNTDHIIAIYGLAVFPALIIIFALNKMIRPFTSY